jgi:glycosyltransferase involved in cell wall biosynthesis
VIECELEYNLSYDLDLTVKENRIRAAYQYGIEASDKKYVLLSHSDILYRGDLIKELLNTIGDAVGIGRLGGCWCCPAGFFHQCDSSMQQYYKPTYKEVIELINRYEPCRTTKETVDYNNPMPLIECKLNDTCAMIDREIMIKECIPNGTSPLQGMQSPYHSETGHGYLRSMVLKGYRFQHYNVYDLCTHGYWAGEAGWLVFLNKEKYIRAEEIAKEYYLKNLK